MTSFRKGFYLTAGFLATLALALTLAGCTGASKLPEATVTPNPTANPIVVTPTPNPTPTATPIPNPTPSTPPTTPAPTATVALNAPSDLSAAKVNDYEVNLKWKDNSAGEAGFHIETATSPDFKNGLVFSVNAELTSYSDKSVAPTGDTYYYRVTAFAPDGKESAPSNVASVTISIPKVSKPNPPTGLTLASANSGQIDLRWTDNSADETGFQLDRAGDRDFTQDVVSVMIPANATTYSDTTVIAGTTYFYRIIAINAVAPSQPSDILTVVVPANTTAPGAPTNLAASAIAPDQVHLSWTNTTTNQVGFVIERATNTSFANPVRQMLTAPEQVRVTTFQDTAVSSGTTYYYRVFAVNNLGSSPPSNVATTTTP